MKESFDHLPQLLESLAWVQELFVLVSLEIEIDDKDDVDKEIDRLKVCCFEFILPNSCCRYYFVTIFHM